MRRYASAALTLGVSLGAALPAPAAHSNDGELDRSLLGGNASVRDDGIHAFSFPVRFLDAKGRRAFAVGNAFFKDNWVAAPASAEGRDGLGPLFNARSCSSCHLRDGRGRPPLPGEDAPTGLLLRVGVPGDDGEHGDAPHPLLGVQLQDRSIEGVTPEATLSIDYETIRGAFGDGEAYELERPVYRVTSSRARPIEAGAGGMPEPRTGARVAPQLVGLGLLESIPERDLVERADPDDEDGDGISGRAHFVRGLRSGELQIGRFGWKATQPTVEEQVAAAFVHDMGITSSLFPDEPLTAAQRESVEYVSGGAPELTDHKLERVTFYSQVLAVPAQRRGSAPEVLRGEELFDTFGCVHCHVPEWTTAEDAVLEGFAGQVIRPYTDLLLHDMGPELADEKRDGDAAESEWRTPPLWGVGLFDAVNGHTRYLHDGRARNLTEAVLWHDGEAEAAREAFRSAERGERAALIAFLESL